MTGWKSDFAFQRPFAPRVKQIGGPHILEEAPLDIDQHEATDFMVLRARDLRIACRIRKYQYFSRWPWEFTIRSLRETGSKTELAKILEGWGDLAFYAFAAPRGPDFVRWTLFDLDVFREAFRRGMCGSKNSNHDGTYFHSFDFRKMPPNMVRAASWDLAELYSDTSPPLQRHQVSDLAPSAAAAEPWPDF